MKNLGALLIVALLAGVMAYFSYERFGPKPQSYLPESLVGATLLDGLGDHDFPVTSEVPEVQRWFNQGLMLSFGFNHDGAERSFLRATELDPDCAMCWWGAALVLGPHVNSGMEPANVDRAWSRLQRALDLADDASEREQAFINALATRYAAAPPEPRTALDQAYATAMGEVAAKYPDDLDAASFHAEALMNLQPWEYYDADLNPKGNTAEIVSILESVIERNPDHALALHLYIHAVEASADPERGVAAADHLRELIPGSGHLVHMPAHIYGRVGRWHDAVIANEAAIQADDTYLEMCRGNAQGLYPLGYVPHNHHFLWFAASMEGDSTTAREAARHTAERTNLPEVMRTPGYEGMQHLWLTPWFEMVRFGRWEEVTSLPNPAEDLIYVSAIWNYAQATAALRQGRLKKAHAHHATIKLLTEDPALETQMIWGRYPLSRTARIARLVVSAEIGLASENLDKAISKLREAVAIEDAIPYDEPPGWHAPVRQTLGVALLAAGKPAEAEQTYREELRRNPHNGWSLKGLALSLQAQGKTAEAKAAEAEFAAAWQNADITLTASRL